MYRGPCIGIIYTHPSRVGGIDPLFPPASGTTLINAILSMTITNTEIRPFNMSIGGNGRSISLC